jgi:hypothetical protein
MRSLLPWLPNQVLETIDFTWLYPKTVPRGAREGGRWVFFFLGRLCVPAFHGYFPGLILHEWSSLH